MIKKICELYETTEEELLEVLDSNNVITRTNSFKKMVALILSNKTIRKF
jgi:type III restriction enzyme